MEKERNFCLIKWGQKTRYYIYPGSVSLELTILNTKKLTVMTKRNSFQSQINRDATISISTDIEIGV